MKHLFATFYIFRQQGLDILLAFTTFALVIAQIFVASTDIVEKAFTRRFGFDSVESRKFLTFVKNKATVNASWVCFYSSLLY